MGSIDLATQWPVGGAPVSPHMKLLMHMDGANGSTTFVDEAGHIVTNPDNGGGPAQISTAQSKFGGASGLFTSSNGQFLTIPGTDFALGTEEFLVQMWVRPTNSIGERTLFSLRGTDGANQANNIRLFAFNNFVVLAAAGADRAGAEVLSDLTWGHIAFLRSSNTLRLFYAGQQIGNNYTDNNNYVAPDIIYIGGEGTPNTKWNGHFDEVSLERNNPPRAVEWFDGFTPPAAPFTMSS